MIIYIHGFGSSAVGGKASILRERYKTNILIPSLSNIPDLAVDTLEQLIIFLKQKGEKINLIGSSLGGFYAIYLANKYNLKAVLINPAIYPYKTLNKIGKATNYYDLSTFECNKNHLEQLKKFEIKDDIKNQENFFVLLKKGDEVLDYKEVLEKMPKAKAIVKEGGDHSFTDFEMYLKEVENFFK
ncbi:YqiA/YcfP family alpha/beta fold hydrolase [Arcobacter sp. CECT 8985]|uniref:YqiA/YcfP family alpha/beta fold hydrolase n=1 Tax=Arcobacter sp. CECT 8985 TaxID=1935424 RepID=UPI00100AE289|nr:YqiA/YcfP family alpha/beta fold hydrolase [Arcobacter sp. CECT 8985]RXJ87375.1 esterase [Arcobacter sp. CECT 8985]